MTEISRLKNSVTRDEVWMEPETRLVEAIRYGGDCERRGDAALRSEHERWERRRVCLRMGRGGCAALGFKGYYTSIINLIAFRSRRSIAPTAREKYLQLHNELEHRYKVLRMLQVYYVLNRAIESVNMDKILFAGSQSSDVLYKF